MMCGVSYVEGAKHRHDAENLREAPKLILGAPRVALLGSVRLLEIFTSQRELVAAERVRTPLGFQLHD